MKGLVLWFNTKKGYGFIRPDDGSKDIFAHFSSIKSDDKYKELYENEPVEFEEARNDKGRIASNIVSLSEADDRQEYRDAANRHIKKNSENTK